MIVRLGWKTNCDSSDLHAFSGRIDFECQLLPVIRRVLRHSPLELEHRPRGARPRICAVETRRRHVRSKCELKGWGDRYVRDIKMLVSAEVRWFWRNECPDGVRTWFFKSGLPPGGGRPRIDRYLPQPSNAELGIKERGDAAGLEIKGLVAARTSPALAELARHLEIWCKWSCVTPDLKLTAAVALTKTRWLRRFDTSKPARVEIPFDADEQPESGYALLGQGCNIELTEVRGLSRTDVWWTLGFEAFDGIEAAPTNLLRTILPEKAILAGIVSSGALLSYPGWLLARLAE